MKHSGGTEKTTIQSVPQETPAVSGIANGAKSIGHSVRKALHVLFRSVYGLRSVFMAIPVILAALRLAAYNSEHLPLMVGINLQTTGEFAKMISRQSAVNIPLMITGGCLVLTIFSRKNLYPWLISVFSLAIPVLLLVTNLYPA